MAAWARGMPQRAEAGVRLRARARRRKPTAIRGRKTRSTGSTFLPEARRATRANRLPRGRSQRAIRRRAGFRGSRSSRVGCKRFSV